jgi:hypothetical protein
MITSQTISIDNLQQQYPNKGTYANTRSFIRSINRFLELAPDTGIYTDHYIASFSKIVCHMIASETYANVMQLSSKLGSLSGAIQRTLKPNEPNKFATLVKSLSSDTTPLNMPVRPMTFTAEPWDDLKVKFERILSGDYFTNAKVIALCYMHEYCLRISEIYHTAIEPIDGCNYLNLDTCIWTINNHKNFLKQGKPRVFEVTREFVEQLKLLLNPHSFYLLHKKNFTPYTTCFTHNTANMPADIPSNSEVRNSFEEYHWKSSGRSQEQLLHHSINVLGHQESTVREHYTRNDTVLEINAMMLRKPIGYTRCPLRKPIGFRKEVC